MGHFSALNVRSVKMFKARTYTFALRNRGEFPAVQWLSLHFEYGSVEFDRWSVRSHIERGQKEVLETEGKLKLK